MAEDFSISNYQVVAFTRDGAINRAGTAFEKLYNHFPHDEAFVKVEEIESE